MATRFYLESSVAADISPAFSAGWESTGSAIRKKPGTVKAGSAFATVAISDATAAVRDILHYQGITDPIGAQTITGTVQGQVRCQENFLANLDGEPQIRVYVVSNDGSTVRGVLLELDTNTTADAHEYATSLTNRSFPRGGSAAVSSVTAVNGDRLVFEVGTRKTAVSSTSRIATLDFGSASGSDLAVDESTTTQNNPWIEFSFTIAGASGGGANTPQAVDASAGATVTVTRGVGKSVAASAGAAATVARNVGKRVSASAAATAAVTKNIAKTISATAGATATATRAIGKTVAAAAGAACSLGRAVGKGVSVTAGAVCSMSRAVGKTVAAAAGASLTITKGVGKTVRAAAGAVLQLVAALVPGTTKPVAVHVTLGDAPATQVDIADASTLGVQLGARPALTAVVSDQAALTVTLGDEPAPDVTTGDGP